MKTNLDIELINYIETPRHCNNPIKIDEILQTRMKAFMKARRMRRFMLVK